MKIQYGKGCTEYGPGVLIELTGNEVALAIDDYLTDHNVIQQGPRTIRVNGDLCKKGEVYVDPSGSVVDNNTNEVFSGRGPKIRTEVSDDEEKCADYIVCGKEDVSNSKTPRNFVCRDSTSQIECSVRESDTSCGSYLNKVSGEKIYVFSIDVGGRSVGFRTRPMTESRSRLMVGNVMEMLLGMVD